MDALNKFVYIFYVATIPKNIYLYIKINPHSLALYIMSHRVIFPHRKGLNHDNMIRAIATFQPFVCKDDTALLCVCHILFSKERLYLNLIYNLSIAPLLVSFENCLFCLIEPRAFKKLV